MSLSKQDDLFYLGLKLILRNPTGLILLLKRDTKKEVFWELPGGRIQTGETQESCLHRELLEETGITDIVELEYQTTYLSPYRIYAQNGLEAGLLFYFYTGRTAVDKVTLSKDHVEYAWVDEIRAQKLLAESYGLNVSELIQSSLNTHTDQSK